MSTHIILNSLMRKVCIGYNREKKDFFCEVEPKFGIDEKDLTKESNMFVEHKQLAAFVEQTFGRRPAFTNALKYLEDEPKMKRGKERNARDRAIIDWTNGVPFEVKE